MKWKWITALVFFSLIFCFPARADMGPKPEINIIVKNPPLDTYYMDLMIEGANQENLFQNLREQEQYDETMLQILKANREAGWHLGIVDGTNIPMSGKLVGKSENGVINHRFGYVGVPDRFKIIVVTKSGEVKVSKLYDRHSFVSNLVFDYGSGEVTSNLPLAVAYLFQFVSTCIPTLMLEGLLLLIFGFSKKKNWVTFLLVNLITQVLLTGLLGSTLIKSGLFSAMILQFPLELLIMTGETIAYTVLLQGHGKGRRIGYGIVANFCSWILGFIIITFQFLFIVRIS